MESLSTHDIELVRADNPGPFTLTGTNTWLVGRGPCYVIDPGPAMPEHLERVLAGVRDRGGIGGIALTHDHLDHAEAVGELRARAGDPPVAAARHPADIALGDGAVFGPLRAIATPGHAPDHVAFLAGRALFSGDAVLGEGSVFVFPDPGALAGYLAALERLRQLDLVVICPGHGPVVWEAKAKLQEYLEHRAERERALLLALDDGRRSVRELLDAAWPEVPLPLRGAARATLAAHLDRLGSEGRLPAGVERPAGGAGA